MRSFVSANIVSSNKRNSNEGLWKSNIILDLFIIFTNWFVLSLLDSTKTNDYI